MVSLTRPRICVDVVEANVARVSEVNATSPPCLRLAVIAARLLSVVRVISLAISRVLFAATVKVPEATDVIASPLIDVAVAAPNVGLCSIGDVKVLLVRV